MSIKLGELRIYGCAKNPLNDSETEIGGAIDTSVTLEFTDISGSFQVVSEEAADNQNVTVYFRTATSVITSETKALQGKTPVGFAGTAERILRGVKGASTSGSIAVEAATATRAGTAQGAGGAANTIQLDNGASAVNGAYNGEICRLTGGTGNGEIARVIDYDGVTKIAVVSKTWAATLDGTTQFRIAKGMLFEKQPHEIMTVLRVFYNAGANPNGGATKEVHDKFFYKNTSTESLTLTNAKLVEASDPSGLVTYAIGTAVDDTVTNGEGNTRLTAPSSGVTAFNNSDKDLPGNALAAGSAIAVWGRLTLAGGAAATKSFYFPRLDGSTI